ncbi:MAG: tRNA pseudouridine(13) synthase TruD [Candidatus Thorarchaeota archaeon]|nr:tRNA pseudouridine(13) synthase TruD [Candidatus Thorarchaeota archaeon]
MRPAHPLEQQIGMEFYSTDFEGIGGRVKARYEDFLVEEITPDGNILSLQPWPNESLRDLPVPSEVHGIKSRYVTLAVQKMGLSTIDVASILAAELRLPSNSVTYAGLKDRRAITVQAMSIPANATERLASAKLSRILVYDAAYTRKPVQVGDLWGNRFTIALRDVEVPLDTALDCAQSLLQHQLLNYFDVQRFGVSRPYTHVVGRFLVRGDFESAVRQMLVTQDEHGSTALAEARQRQSEELAPDKALLDELPEELRYERAVVQHLIKRPGDYAGAIRRIPPRVLTIFVHAYQSFLFNRLISGRMRRGMSIEQPEAGDFIIQRSSSHSGRDSWIFVSERRIDECQELVKKGDYVLASPVPGYSTKMPPSPQTDLLRELLAQEGTDLLDFRNPEMRPLDSPGGLHPVSLRAVNASAVINGSNITLSFSLQKGSYATVVLRELMKNHPLNRV